MLHKPISYLLILSSTHTILLYEYSVPLYVMCKYLYIYEYVCCKS